MAPRVNRWQRQYRHVVLGRCAKVKSKVTMGFDDCPKQINLCFVNGWKLQNFQVKVVCAGMV